MTTDPFDRLRALNPVPTPGGLLAPHDDPDAIALLNRVLGEADSEAIVRHRRRGRRIIIPAVVAAAAAATAAAAWVITRPADDPTQVACYRDVDLSADIVGAEPVGGDPTAACTPVWENGEFGGGRPPLLEACVLDSGIVGVFPATGGDPCGRLGLDRAGPQGEEPPIVAIQDRLADRLGAACVPIDDAVALIEDELREAGLGDWTVVAPGAGFDDRPCASVGIDGAARTISVVPIPKPPAG